MVKVIEAKWTKTTGQNAIEGFYVLVEYAERGESAEAIAAAKSAAKARGHTEIVAQGHPTNWGDKFDVAVWFR